MPPRFFTPVFLILAAFSVPSALLAQTTSATANTNSSNVNNAIKADQKAVMVADSCKKPDYPKLSLKQEEQGTTRVKMTVSADGKLVFSSVLISSGFELLDTAAIAALNHCQFRPAYQSGQPLASSLVMDYVWQLPGVRKKLAGSLSFSGPAAVTEKINLADHLDDALPGDPELRTGKLDNGLTYYIRRNTKPKQHVELRLVVKAGSILEDDDQRGLAHFAEHLAFDGTQHFPKHTLIAALESLGVKFGADLNAFTSFDDTIYILQLPLDKPDNLTTGLQILEDWAQGAQMADDAIELERPVVLEESRMTKGASDRMNKLNFPQRYNGSRYALRAPIGLESVLSNFKPEAVRRFYHDWYRPDLEAVIVVGDFDPDEVETSIRAHFSALTNPAPERVRSYAPIAARNTSAGQIITDKEAAYNTLLIRYPVQTALPKITIGDFRQFLVRSLCLGMMNQRLMELTQEASPPFVGATYAVEPSAPGMETLMASAITGHGGITPAINALGTNVRQLQDSGFSAEELERSKKNLQHHFDGLYAERFGTHSASFADDFRRQFLFQEATMGLEYHHSLATELIPAVTLDEVNRLVRLMIPKDAPRLVTYMGTPGTKKSLPSGPQLLAQLNHAEHAVAAPYGSGVSDRPLPLALMAQPPKGGSIVSRIKNEQLGLTELTLSNGVKVIFKPTYLQKQQVLLSAARFGGQSLFANADNFNASYASTIQSAMGFGDFTPLEMSKILTGKTASLQTTLSLYSETIVGSADSDDLETLLQWLYLAMTAPRSDKKLFAAYLGRLQDLAKNSMLQPDSVFQEKLYAALFNNHPRTPFPARSTDFDKISMERIMAIYQQRFGSADGLTFIITGSIDVDKISSLVTSYLGALPTSQTAQHYRDIGLKPVSGKLNINVKAGTEDKSQVVMMFNGPAAYSLKEANIFYAAAEIIKQRINHVLREQLSLIYSSSMSSAFQRVPEDFYNISIDLPCAPENTYRVTTALLQEIENLKNEGPQPEELERVKQIWLKERQTTKQTNQFWSEHIQDAVLYNTDAAVMFTYDARINAITAEQVKTAAQHYFNMENIVQAVLYPAQVNKTAMTAQHNLSSAAKQK